MAKSTRSVITVPQKKSPPDWFYEAARRPPKTPNRNSPYAQWAKVHDRKGYREHLRLCDHAEEINKQWQPLNDQEILEWWEDFSEVVNKHFPKPVPELRVLGLAENTDYTKREVRNAYRRKARKLHPDVGGDAEAFKQLYAAYRAVLAVARSE